MSLRRQALQRLLRFRTAEKRALKQRPQLRRLLPTLALALLALVLLPGQAVRASESGPGQAPDSGPTEITIAAIGLESVVTPVGFQLSNRKLEWETVDDAVGWYRTSAMPGSPGNAVFSGHNASLGSGVFRNLHKVKVGDTVTVTAKGREIAYRVTERVILPDLWATKAQRAANAAWLGQFGDERLTLITCYPWYTNTHRLVLVAHPVTAPAR